MAIRILEFFGYGPLDPSQPAQDARGSLGCPFIGDRCQKTLNDGAVSGACTVRQVLDETPVIVCPIRLYDKNYHALLEVAQAAFGTDVRLLHPDTYAEVEHDGRNVVYFGKGVGKELKLPTVGGRGGFYVDWVLALIARDGSLAEFVAVEVQSIDTTGNYRVEREAYLRGEIPSASPGGINWENVSKRILPQIIYKSHVLALDRLCKGGLFFVCPGPVYRRIVARLGGNLRAYPRLGPNTITFRWYDPSPAPLDGERRGLVWGGQFTTSVDQVALGFTAPANLPPDNAFEGAIRRELQRIRAGRQPPGLFT